jgi:hypothetical protein
LLLLLIISLPSFKSVSSTLASIAAGSPILSSTATTSVASSSLLFSAALELRLENEKKNENRKSVDMKS